MAFNIRKFLEGIRLIPKSSSTIDSQGEMEVLSASGKLNYHNGTSASPLISESHSATLTNKSIDADTNTITNIDNNEIKAAAGIAYSKLNLTTSIVDGDVAAAAAIARTKLANGTANHVVINNGSGTFSSEAQLAGTRGGTGVSNSGTLTYGSNNITVTTSGTTSLTVPTSGTVATLAGTESLSNKTFSDAITGAQIATPSNPSSGYNKAYFKSDNELYKLTSGGIETKIGSGSGDAVDYITNFRGDNGTTGWATYNDSSGSRPTDGTGGSPSNIAITTTATNPLSGSISLLLQKTGSASTQGQGYSYDFTIQRRHRGKVLRGRIQYEIASGTYSGGSSSTDSDLIVYLYRTTATARLIEPTPIKLMGSVSGQIYELPFEFQTDSDADGYRLIIHHATTSTSNFEVKFEAHMAPQEAGEVAIIGDWTAFTPTGSWTTNSTYTGYYRRVGDSAEIRVGVSLSGAPTSTTLTINLPSGLVIDSNKVTSMVSNGAPAALGTFSANDTGISSYNGTVAYNSSTSIICYRDVVSGSQITSGVVNATNPFTWGSGDLLEIVYLVPIVGWSSAQIVNDGAARTVAAQFEKADANQTLSNNTETKISISAARSDTTGAFDNTNDRFIAPVSGYYRCTASVGYTGNSTGVRMAEVRRNSVDNQANKITAYSVPHSSSTTVTQATGIFYLKSGEYVEAFGYQNSGGNLDVQGNPNQTFLAVERIAGPEQVVAAEKIYAEYKISGATANTSLSNNTDTVVDANVKTIDSHNAVTTGAAWKFTAPRAGEYAVSATCALAAVTAGAVNNKLELMLFKNGSRYKFLNVFRYQTTAASVIAFTSGSTLINLNAGDYIQIEASQNTGGAVNISTTGDDVHISIWSI